MAEMYDARAYREMANRCANMERKLEETREKWLEARDERDSMRTAMKRLDGLLPKIRSDRAEASRSKRMAEADGQDGLAYAYLKACDSLSAIHNGVALALGVLRGDDCDGAYKAMRAQLVQDLYDNGAHWEE